MNFRRRFTLINANSTKNTDIGALHSNRASKSVFITTSCFSLDAEKVAAESHVVLIDGETLAGYMVDFNVGVSIEITYDQKKIDEDFFEE